MNNMQINGKRLWQSLMDMAKIGATEKGGCCRLALTDLDRECRNLFVQWLKKEGCTLRIDTMGNIFAHRPGRNETLPPVITGSHLDTQPTGGKFDGVYGVLAGLEILRTLNDYNYETEAPIEVVVWTNEEGSRFVPPMTGSGVFAGAYDLDFGHSRADLDGVTLGKELGRIGYLGKETCGQKVIGSYFELHIEQGPILETEGRTIGIVTGAQGLNCYNVRVLGMESHAGTTPMNSRSDALLGASKIIIGINQIAVSHKPYGVGTVGCMEVRPNSRNTIPDNVFFSVDIRHPDAGALEQMDAELHDICLKVCDMENLTFKFERVWHSLPIIFDANCVAVVRECARSLGLRHMDIISGASHDACNISRVAPTAMVFIPCKNGISHNEIETATFEDVRAGCNVLLHALLKEATP
jgi:N-carbamoyl-L-amino-acid hydrolase